MPSKCWQIFGLICLLMPALASAGDAPPPLSLESTILFALHQNPAVMAEMEKIKQSNFAVDEARAAYYPQVSMEARGGHEYDFPQATKSGSSTVGKTASETNSGNLNLIVSQVLYNGFATDEEVYRRQALVNSSFYGSLIVIETTLQGAIGYYTDVWQYQRAVTESEEFLDSLKKMNDKIILMHEAGAESKTKREYIESRYAAAQSELNRNKALLADAFSNLESVTGPLPPFIAERPLQMDPTVRTLDSYYELANKDNNHLRLNASDHSAVEHQIEEQEAAYDPVVSLELNGRVGHDNGGNIGNSMNGSAMLVMEYKLFDGFSRDSAEGRMRSQKTENEYRQEQLQRDTYKDIRKSYNQIAATKQDLASNMKEILSSESLQELYRQQFELGEGDLITMVEGAERLHTAKIRSYKLEAGMVDDSYALLQKVGALRKEGFCASC